MHILKRLLLFLLVGAGAQSLHSSAALANPADEQPPTAPKQQADETATPGQSAAQVSSGSPSSGLDAEKERQARDLLHSVMSGSEPRRTAASPPEANRRKELREQALAEARPSADVQT